MRAHHSEALTTTSAVAELPHHGEALDDNTKARRLAELFQARPSLPGVLLTHHGRVYSAVSRRYYFEMVGGYCGKDLYDGRPIRLMMGRFEELGGVLEIDGRSSIRAAVERGLGRPRELLYEPIVVRFTPSGEPGTGAVLVDFEDLLIADSRLSNLRNLQMGQILDTVGEGLLLIRDDRRLSSECSRFAQKLLGTSSLAGRTLPELLFERLDAETCRLAEEFVEVLFRPDVIENLVTGLNPLSRVVLRNPGAAPRVASFRFARHVEAGRVPHVLVRIEDITEREEQARVLAGERESTELRLTLAAALFEAEPEALEGFLARVEERVGGLAASSLAPRELARELHALKGEAGFLGLGPFRTVLHELEEGVTLHRKDGQGVSGAVERLATLTATVRALVARFRRATSAPSTDPLERLGNLVLELGRELGKEVRFVRRLETTELPSALLAGLQDALVQLARNAVVHGIERPEARVAAGKPRVGTLQLAARSYPAHGVLELIFQDDGAGIDPDLAERIFEPGFTTASKVDAHAGRGVGLDLVRSRVGALGGRVSAHGERGRFCAFRILLPHRAEVAA